MLKTICVKTNNKNISNHLLKELEYFELDNIYVSCYDFKKYTNVIVHYVGNDTKNFLSKISILIAYSIIDFYEPHIISNLINLNYFYFSTEEKSQIYNLCLTNIDFKSSISLVNIITNTVYKYFQENKYLVLDGFVNFRLHEYIKELDSLVDMCVNKFIIDREYKEFISLLKSYVETTPCNSSIVHLIYKNENTILLDNKKNVIPYKNDIINPKYLSDISFSTNDYALNSLLTLLPSKLYIHLIDNEDDFIDTIKLIFNNRVYICTDCNICSIYKKSNSKFKIPSASLSNSHWLFPFLMI